MLRILAVVCNVVLFASTCFIVLIGFTCWAAVAQYSYPEGTSVIPFGVLMVFTPIISLVVFCGSRKRGEVSS